MKPARLPRFSIRTFCAALILPAIALASAFAQDKPAASPAPAAAVDLDKTDAPEYKEAEKLARSLGPLLEEYAKSKKPSQALREKIWALRGRTVVVEGGFLSEGDPGIMGEGDVDYLFHFDLNIRRMDGLGVFGTCAGVISYIDPVKKIVVLDHAAVRFLGAD